MTIKSLEDIATITAGDNVCIVKRDGGMPSSPCTVKSADGDALSVWWHGSARIYSRETGENWQSVTRIATRAEVEAWEAQDAARRQALADIEARKDAAIERVVNSLDSARFALSAEQWERLAELLEESAETGFCMIDLAKQDAPKEGEG